MSKKWFVFKITNSCISEKLTTNKSLQRSYAEIINNFIDCLNNVFIIRSEIWIQNSIYLKVQNDGPNESKNNSWFSIHNITSIDVDQFDLQ